MQSLSRRSSSHSCSNNHTCTRPPPSAALLLLLRHGSSNCSTLSRPQQQQQHHQQRSSLQRVHAEKVTERELQMKLAIASSTDRLDLSDCQFAEVPPGVFELTSLHELSLAGNQLQQLPAQIAKLSSLQRLVLAGNLLTQLPDELFGLTDLEGLWVHGNLLQQLPEQLGQLTKLKQLSLAGNCLYSVPTSLTQLVHLEDLNISGNSLSTFPEGLGALTALNKLSLHGNRLTAVPADGWQCLQKLDEVCLQGNQLTAVPDSLAQLGALTELSLADNRIQQLPHDLSGLTALRKAHLYGNCFSQLPMGPSGLPCLLLPSRHNNNTPSSSSSGSNGGGSSGGRSQGQPVLSLWLEGNPLSEECVGQLLELADDAAAELAAASSSSYSSSSSKGGGRRQPRIGLDDTQLTDRNLAAWEQQHQRGCTIVKKGMMKGEGVGYFKLQLDPTSSSQASGNSNNSSGSSSGDRVLLVAFGSAPGLPNWGGIVAKVAAAAESPEEQCFDVLYVVDPHRNWYCGGDAQLMQERYTSRLEQYTKQYKHVVMIGDSMGATAALLFSPLATHVMSFCPQVDLATSSIRPGQSAAWFASLKDTLQAAVGASSARITVFTGTWQHDVDQAGLLSHHPNVRIKVHSYDSHRLALALAGQGKLAPMLREAILSEVGLFSGNVRLTNLL